MHLQLYEEICDICSVEVDLYLGRFVVDVGGVRPILRVVVRHVDADVQLLPALVRVLARRVKAGAVALRFLGLLRRCWKSRPAWCRVGWGGWAAPAGGTPVVGGLLAVDDVALALLLSGVRLGLALLVVQLVDLVLGLVGGSSLAPLARLVQGERNWLVSINKSEFTIA